MNRIFRTLFVIAISVTLAFSQARQANQKGATQTAAVASAPGPENVGAMPHAAPNVGSDFVLGTEDMLSINVWHEAELSRIVQVRPDGKVSLPLVGEVVASGLTPSQLQQKLTKELEAFISHPEVTVIVQEVRSQKINIVGQVNRPGTFPLVKPMTVLDALAQAGGFGTFAKQKDIYVLRTLPSGSQVRLPFNYRKVIKGQNVEQNIELESHDTIVVP